MKRPSQKANRLHVVDYVFRSLHFTRTKFARASKCPLPAEASREAHSLLVQVVLGEHGVSSTFMAVGGGLRQKGYIESLSTTFGYTSIPQTLVRSVHSSALVGPSRANLGSQPILEQPEPLFPVLTTTVAPILRSPLPRTDDGDE